MKERAPLAPLRFASIMSTAMTMSAAVAHLMEMPGKMQYERDLYVRLHRTLYPMFGRAAGPAEAFAAAGTALLSVLLRKRRRSGFGFTATAAALLGAAHGTFWVAVNPANRTMASWPMDAIPSDWKAWRDRWEYAHAARALLVTGAMGALVLSVLRDGRSE